MMGRAMGYVPEATASGVASAIWLWLPRSMKSAWQRVPSASGAAMGAMEPGVNSSEPWASALEFRPSTLGRGAFRLSP